MDNPNIIQKDERIIELNQIVQEVKESEEWEEFKMDILDIGIKKGQEIGEKRGEARGLERGIEVLIESYLEDDMPEDFIVSKLKKKYNLSDKQAKEYINHSIGKN